jgi:amino acid transporter
MPSASCAAKPTQCTAIHTAFTSTTLAATAFAVYASAIAIAATIAVGSSPATLTTFHPARPASSCSTSSRTPARSYRHVHT